MYKYIKITILLCLKLFDQSCQILNITGPRVSLRCFCLYYTLKLRKACVIANKQNDPSEHEVKERQFSISLRLMQDQNHRGNYLIRL